MKKSWILGVGMLPPILLLVSLLTYSFDYEYYLDHYSKNGIPSKFSESREQINGITRELISFISTGRGDISWFSQREQLHLIDVMKLFRTAQVVLIALVLVFVACSLYYISSLSSIFYYGGITTFAVLLLFSLIFLNFNASFYAFHLLSFSNDLWLLSATDKLILLFPEAFFRGIFLHIVRLTFVLGVISIVLGKFMAVKEQKNE